MKLFLSAILLLIILQSLSGQDKTIRGFVIDDYTGYKIEGVQISPDIYDTITLSNDNGKYRIDLPPKFRDTIVFTHPAYYPFIKRIGTGDAMKLNFIHLVPRTFRLDTVCYTAFEENMLLTGEIKDQHKGNPVEDAMVSMEDNKVIAWSNKEGLFKAAIPKSERALIISHDLFVPQTVPLSLNKKEPYELKIVLKKSEPSASDSTWKGRNNLLLFSVVELFNGGVGLRYERFIKPRHSIGLHATAYFFGVSWPYHFGTMDDNRFHGWKLAPFYHYYVLRTSAYAGYAEIKPIIAYYDFYKLDYARDQAPEYEKNFSTTFWTGGISAAWGWLFFPKRSNYTIGLSVGMQFLPMHVPDTITDENGAVWEFNKTWWYFGGPGSLFEFKFMLGGIF